MKELKILGREEGGSLENLWEFFLEKMKKNCKTSFHIIFYFEILTFHYIKNSLRTS
jgi:hypothetical protein